MSEKSGEKFNQTLEQDIMEMRQIIQDLILGKISNKEAKAKRAEFKRNRIEKEKVINEAIKKYKAEQRLNNK